MKTASIIMCAGIGSRLKSAKSKMLHQVCGRPLSFWPIKNALEATSLKPTVVVGHQGEDIEDALNQYFKDRLHFAKQPTPNGTGGAVMAALSSVPSDCQSILVLCGDTPLLNTHSLQKLLTIQRQSHMAIGLLTAIAPDPTGYGRIVRNAQQQIVGIVEEEEATSSEAEIKEVNTGVYVFDADFLRTNITMLKNENRKMEYYLTDIVAHYIKHGSTFGPVGSVEISYEEMHGINDRRQLAYAQKVLNRRLLDRWMLDGVTIIDPDQTIIEEGVRLAKDAIIYPGVHLRGETHIGENCVIENGSVIKNTVMEKNARVLPYCYCDSAFIGERSSVGPFAHLRPGARLESDVKIGNFVEIKNSRLKKGTKASHLAYIGDAEVGEHCNIGAGAITCNFDGKNKHHTVIGDGAFIGSNTTLIAPLTIGDKAYVAAGSTISKEIPRESLAFGRAKQVNKDRGSRQMPTRPRT